ncbi:glycosyltransferase [Brevundimonas sp. BAL3]|uniref:glycosyltransferase family protein n=1 Tax=Brevundimonas sp. BAL3 TaxID=391600 RepID=UPI0005907EA8|nr:glycosyltransferase [Brevundimonas sp. BAL3]
MGVVLVNYGIFNSNSGGHTAHFANALAEAGENVWVLGAGDPDAARDFGEVKFNSCSFDDLKEYVPTRLTSALAEPGAIVHGWTPRETVKGVIDRLVAETEVPYIVHLEDNEDVIARSQLGADWDRFARSFDDPAGATFPAHLSHPVRSRALLKRAAGVTVIADALRSTVETTAPIHLLEPGVDASLFSPLASETERQAARRALYIAPDAKVIVYHGNMHSANRRDMFSLYTALTILKRRGVPVVLIRSGVDHGADFDVSMEFLRRDVIDLGLLPRDEMVAILKLADVYVQPGAVDDFNIYRLPSKVPEFLALGRPVALPRANIGLQLKNDVEAIVLDRGDGLDIADRLERLFANPEQMRTVGAAGRAFALRELDWKRNAAALLGFYRDVLLNKAETKKPTKRVKAK